MCEKNANTSTSTLAVGKHGYFGNESKLWNCK